MKTAQKLAVPAAFPGAGRFDGSVPDMAQVRSLTKLNSVRFLQSRISVKRCFFSCFRPCHLRIASHI